MLLQRAKGFRWAFAASMAAVLIGSSFSSAGVIYFSDAYYPTTSDGFIRSVNTDGSGLQTILSIGGGVRGMDVAGNRIFWSDVDNDVIQRSYLDGSGVETVVGSGLSFPMSVATDAANNRLYWGDAVLGRIDSSDMDGGGAAPLLTTPFGSGLELYGGKLYWTTAVTGDSGDIMRANPDGSDPEVVLTGEGKPSDIALFGGKVYWTDYVLDRVRRANLDGTGVEDLYIVGANWNPGGITIDPVEQKVYWAQSTGVGYESALMRMNLDGSEQETLLSGIGIGVSLCWVPEPTALALLAVGALALRRRS
jgi:hypothetical protein